MSMSPLLEQLIQQLRILPGIGPKSAQRMAFHLLARNRQGGKAIAHALQLAMTQIQHCEQCRTFSETTLCSICSNQKREHRLLCIVETPADMLAVEHTGYRGVYFLLLGHLSPIDGIGPQEIGLDILHRRLQQDSIEEIIIATNPTVEGEATAHYIIQLAKQAKIPCSRIAHGVPFGDVLEYIDTRTLGLAISGRAQCLEIE
jgi:recombination protein RecR